MDARRVNKKVLESLIKVGALIKFGQRASLMASIDEVRDKVVKKYADNQQGLFSQEDIEKSSLAAINNLFSHNIPEFGDEEIESLERQLLGFSLSAKPIGEILEPFEVNATHKIAELGEEITLQENVTIAAVVKEVRVIITRKSGQEMAFVKVEDTSGSLEIVVFPKIFSITRDLWVDNKPLIIFGKVDHRDDSVSLIVENVSATTSQSSNPNRLYIKIPKKTQPEQLRRLKTLLLANPGDKHTTLFFEENKKKIDLPYNVDWTHKLAQEINSLLRDYLPS